MRKELKDFLKSEDMILYLPRDYNKDIISQWTNCRSLLRPPLNWFLIKFAKLIPITSWICSYYRFFLRMKIGKLVGFAQINPDHLLPEAIEIGDYSAFGWKVSIFTHEFTQHRMRFGKVKIGKNVLVGAFSIIRSGVSIGHNSIIAPYSFVIGDIPANEIWGGNPAIKIRDKSPLHKHIDLKRNLSNTNGASLKVNRELKKSKVINFDKYLD